MFKTGSKQGRIQTGMTGPQRPISILKSITNRVLDLKNVIGGLESCYRFKHYTMIGFQNESGMCISLLLIKETSII